MRTYILLFFCLFSSQLMVGQFNLDVSSLSGFESNILRVPDQLLDDDELITSDELYRSSYFQDVIATLEYEKEMRTSVLNIFFKPQRRFFFSESDSDRLILNLKVNYTLDISKYKSWENEIQYYQKDQNGLDADENELGTTFAYNLVNVDSKLNFRLYKSNRSFIGLHCGKKNFDPTETREVSYHKYGITAGFKNIKWTNHLLRSFGFTSSLIQRKYDITSIDEDEIATNGNRTWNYINFKGYLKIEMIKGLILYPSISYENRIDQSDNRFGYTELEPKLFLSYKNERIDTSVSVSYSKRNFTDLIVNQNDLLSYDYIRLRFNLSYKVSDKLALIANTYFINRESNNNDLSAVTFRSYNNYYAGLGIRFAF
ncbi:MAG: hypothetical protein ACWA5P_12530 [bacterium]